MPADSLKLLILGAHPDDAEFHAGGIASIYRSLGHTVKMISVTNGAAGHHERAPGELAALRRVEAANAGKVIGAEYVTWDNPDSQLTPSLEVRRQIVVEIRTFRPDLVLTHRPCDYHPDHRAVGQAVQDASYMVTVPLFAPEAPALREDPVVAYMPDLFTKPYPLSPDVVVDITEHVDTIVRMLACHVSQVFEWLPYNHRVADQVPEGEKQRFKWLRGWYAERATARADRFRNAIISAYGKKRGKKIEFAEVFEISEYAGEFTDEKRKKLFPFAP